MSILIKGMETPTNCAACRIGHRDTGWDNEDNEHEIVFCPIIQQGSLIADANVKRHQLCPLVPVPPHGRLIDADELHKLFIKKGKEFKGIGGAMLAAAWCIANAPTIIPAQTEKEGQ